MVGKSDTTRLTRSWLRGALSRPLQACNGASTSFQPAATDPLHSAVAHVRIGISNVIPMRDTGFWRSPSMLTTWWRRRRPTLSQPGEKQRRLVFVLGGGGSRGACSVGVMKALLEAGIKPDGLVGCSSGAFNAVALAANVGLPEAIQLGATHIVAIDNSTSNPRRPPNHTLTGILAQSIQIMLGQRMLEEYQRYSGQAEICLMFPNVEFGTAGTDFSQVDRLIDEAYARTRGLLQAGGLDRRGPLDPGLHYMLPARPPSALSP